LNVLYMGTGYSEYTWELDIVNILGHWLFAVTLWGEYMGMDSIWWLYIVTLYIG
jgi:hypothetical protein